MNHYAVIGKNVSSYSLSPQIHNSWIRANNIKADYNAIDVDDLREFVNTHNLTGYNVTIPYKAEIIPYLSEIDPLAKAIGAVNTVYNNKGYNTDYFGIEQTIKSLKCDLSKVMVIGAGGAAKAIIKYLADQNCDIYIVNRTKKAENIINFNEANEIKQIDLLINTTPLGMMDENLAKILNLQSKDLGAVIDIIYHKQTPLLKFAYESNIPHSDGKKMLYFQAAKSFEIWFGIFPVELTI